MIEIKEEFATCDKAKRALLKGGGDAICMWLAMKAYAATNLTNGFVPDEEIDRLPLSPKNPRKQLEVLVGCGRILDSTGARGPGLVEQVPHGWQLHDYEDHANSAEQERERRRKAREQKAARRAFLRGQPDRTTPDSPRVHPRTTGPDNTGQSSRTRDLVSADSHARPGAGPLACARGRDPTPPHPKQPEEQPPRPDGLVPCPADLRLLSDQRKTLETAMIPGWAIDALTTRFIVNYQAKPSDQRSLDAWLKCLSQAICGWWNNSKSRPSPPSSQGQTDETGGYGKASEWT